MKKIILPLLLVIATFLANAQPCVPGTISIPQAGYVLPDSATNFAHACVGLPYDQIVYIKAPKDTLFGVILADIDSFVVNKNVSGLPPGLMVESVPGFTPASPPNPKTNFDRLIIKKDSMACIKISGTIPTGTTPSVYNLVIEVRAYVKTFGGLIPVDTPVNITYYQIKVLGAPCWPASLNEIGKPDFNLNAVMPNPAQSFTEVSIESPRSQDCQLLVLNMLGETVFHQSLKLQAGINRQSINTASFPNGLYILNLKGDQGNLSYKFQVQQ